MQVHHMLRTGGMHHSLFVCFLMCETCPLGVVAAAEADVQDVRVLAAKHGLQTE